MSYLPLPVTSSQPGPEPREVALAGLQHGPLQLLGPWSTQAASNQGRTYLAGSKTLGASRSCIKSGRMEPASGKCPLRLLTGVMASSVSVQCPQSTSPIGHCIIIYKAGSCDMRRCCSCHILLCTPLPQTQTTSCCFVSASCMATKCTPWPSCSWGD